MLKRGNNCNSVNTIRLIAALEVVYVHVIDHLNIINIPICVGNVIRFFDGVPIFFTISGFFIWKSIECSTSFRHYCNKRFFRIFPELFVAVIIEIIVLLLFYNHHIEWEKLILFFVAQVTILQFWTPDFLKAYGCGCPNGALWTICVLIQFYFVSYFVYKWLRGKNWKIWCSVLTLSIFVSWLPSIIPLSVDKLVGLLYNQTLIPYFWMFLVGALISEFRASLIPKMKKYWWIILGLSGIMYYYGIDLKLGNYDLFRSLSLLFSLLGFAYAVPQVNIKTDISYAIYLNHMTVVNAFIVLGYVKKTVYMLLVFIITIIIAYLFTILKTRYTIKIKDN